MANFKYFTQGEELSNVWHDGSIYSTSKHFSGINSNGVRVQVERAIQRKNNPSMHKCDARCTNAKGFLCECSCGGKNHGAGAFVCEQIAA